MNKVIYIGELALNVELSHDGSASTRVGDRIVSAAVLDGMMGVETLFVGEASADAVGDHIVGYLDKNGVDTRSVDRFTEGASPVRISAASSPDEKGTVIHSAFPSEPVNPVWPRVNEGDVVIFGSYMALDKRNHQQIIDLLKHSSARKATVVSMPYFDIKRVPRITRVMPEIFDNLEVADLVLLTRHDLDALFPGEETAAAFRDHILFYCKRCMVMDRDALTMHFFDGNESWTLKCHPTDLDEAHWTAGAVAGVARALAEGMTDPDDIMAKANETAHSELAAGI
ncbi:MAG: hypothetical protein HFJ91_04900 [Muribaculaceae bacterium]|nr:hypothetical protein [Muribaculaceae bacterium]